MSSLSMLSLSPEKAVLGSPSGRLRSLGVMGLSLLLPWAAGCASSESDPSSDRAGVIAVQVSGEELGTEGIPFPQAGEVVVRDGWEVKFDHVLTTVGEVTLSENPDKSPSDASQTDELVARAEGPWAVDVRKPGTVAGAGGEGTATPLVELRNQNERGGKPFELDRRYAFGFSLVPATAPAAHVNFEGDAEAEQARLARADELHLDAEAARQHRLLAQHLHALRDARHVDAVAWLPAGGQACLLFQRERCLCRGVGEAGPRRGTRGPRSTR